MLIYFDFIHDHDDQLVVSIIINTVHPIFHPKVHGPVVQHRQSINYLIIMVLITGSMSTPFLLIFGVKPLILVLAELFGIVLAQLFLVE